VALVLLACAISIAVIAPLLAILFSAFASGIYHVSAPSLCISHTLKKGSAVGLFAAPGVVGLTLGGAIGCTALLPWWAFAVALIPIVLAVISVNKFSLTPETPNEPQSPKHGFDTHDYLMILLLLVVALRSAVWDIFQVTYTGSYEWLFYIAIAAAIGKIAGGVFYDRYNNPLVITITLLFATILLQLQSASRGFLLIGILLLQSTIPTCIMLFYKLMPTEPATANSLVMGLAIVLGSFPYFMWFNPLYLIVMLGTTLVILSWLFTRYYKSTKLS
jgi:FSR family fosmidomycin resistance protein-like MFS transporter